MILTEGIAFCRKEDGRKFLEEIQFVITRKAESLFRKKIFSIMRIGKEELLQDGQGCIRYV